MDYQVVIVGGGPAAHNAALAFGRSRKRVLMCDEGRPENRAAKHSHTFFTRDGTPPLELRRIAIEQLARYDTVEFITDRVAGVEAINGGFHVRLGDRAPASTRLILLAVGMRIGDGGISGLEQFWGETVIHCPYCHGWEVRDLPWAVYWTTSDDVSDVAGLRYWTKNLTVIAREGIDISPDTSARLDELGVTIERGTIRALLGAEDRLETIELEDGRALDRRVLLYAPRREQTALVSELGVALDRAGYVQTDPRGETSVNGIFAAGDLTADNKQIVVAAASGMRTAMAMDGRLAKLD